MTDNNFFDDLKTNIDLADARRQQERNAEKGATLDYLIHKTFKQHKSGRDLLDIWRESLLMQPSATGGMDLVDIGIREGQKRFIRGIILTVDRVEKGEI